MQVSGEDVHWLRLRRQQWTAELHVGSDRRSFPSVLVQSTLAKLFVHRCYELCGLPKLSVYVQDIPPKPGVSQPVPAKVASALVRCTIRRLRNTISSQETAFDPYSYSGGHWLHRDERRQKARRLELNFDALLDVAVKYTEGAHEVFACEKKEGRFNRVFGIELDNSAKVVAKVPMRYAGPAALTTVSEVATMEYGIWHSAVIYS